MRTEAEAIVDEMVTQMAQYAERDDELLLALVDSARRRLEAHWRRLHEDADRRCAAEQEKESA